jgi:hypothetical protein
VLAVSRVLLLLLIAVSFVAESCIWNGDRPLANGDAGEANDLGTGDQGSSIGTGGGNGGSGSGGDSGVAGSPGIGGGSVGAGGTGQGGSIDASQPDVGAADRSPPNDTSSPPTTCGPPGAATKLWSFTSNVDGWDFADGTMVWTGAVGDPDPGALQVDWTGALPVHPRRVEALGDLRGHVVTAHVWVAPGAAVGIKVFVQTGQRYWWADGGMVTPPAGQWTCVTLDIDNPAFGRQQYDPRDVQVLGLELQTTSSGRAYVDQVEY